MQDKATASKKSSVGPAARRAGPLKIPKTSPLPRPPKSPKRYSTASSSRSTVSSAQGPPDIPIHSPESTVSSQASCSTSPAGTECYFDALSLQPILPQEQLARPEEATRSHTKEESSYSRPSFERRESFASSTCLSDEELASRAYAQRQTERRTSVVPLPSPDVPHSQRRRYMRRPPSSASGLSGSQASTSSAAGSIHAISDSEAQSSSSLFLHSEQAQDPPLRWWHVRLDGQQPFLPPAPQIRSTSQRPEIARASHASTSSSTFPRGRLSQDTSLGPFDLDEVQAASVAHNQEHQLQRHFLDSIRRPSSSASDRSTWLLSMPSTPDTFSTRDPTSVSPLQSPHSLPADGQYGLADRFENHCVHEHERLPDRASPPLPSPLSVTSPTSRRSSTNGDARLTSSDSRRASASTNTRKRVGRIYSTSTVTSEGINADELKTPRVSVSHQGSLADSTYSVADEAPDSFPYMADIAKDLPAREDGDVFKRPYASRSRAPTESTVASIDSPTEQFHQHPSSADTAYNHAFRDSISSFTSSLGLAPQTTTVAMTEQEGHKNKRLQIIQELVHTEAAFGRDMALIRDVWLARARGKEMGEIMAVLDSFAADSSRPLSTSSSKSTLARGVDPHDIRIVERKCSAPQMQRNTSQSSFRSLKGLVHNIGKPDNEKLSDRSGHDYGARAVSYGSTPRQRSISNVQPLPPGAALYAPMRQLDADVIFGNIEAVAEFSQQFTLLLREEQAAEESGSGEACIGQAFLKKLSHLSAVYCTYCAHFGDAIQRWDSISDSLASYSQDCKDLCYGHTNAWDLPSLLIKPVQRCLKYPLFIQSLLECTPDAHADKRNLIDSNTAILKVAETMNEMKRRHELVTQLIKRKPRPGLYGTTRRGSDKKVPPVAKAPSGGSFTASLSRKFKRSSRIGLPEVNQPVLAPEPDETFEALLVQLELKHRTIQSFVLDCKVWSKSVRTALVSLLQLSLAWKSVSSLSGQDDTQEASQSSRAIDYYAIHIVGPTVEHQWRDMDKEIRKILVPKATQLLELFSSPRGVIATRYHRYNESHSKAATKDYTLLSEHVAAYHALNAQLKDDLPVFLQGVDRIFTAIVQRLLELQVAFNRRMAQSWQDYVESCCPQLGPPSHSAKESIAQWWQVHSSLAQQLDTLKILNADQVVEDIERRQRASLPPGLRPRISGRQSSTATPPVSEGDILAMRQNVRPSSANVPEVTGGSKARTASSVESASSLARTSAAHTKPVDALDRNSTFSSMSAGSLSFSGRSSSSVTSAPRSSNSDGAVATSFRPNALEKSPKGYAYLSCQPGNVFDVLDEVSGEEFLLVRQEGSYGDVGWLPAHLLHKLE